jgi:polyhydroxyalkanoate synthase subunit PhaC
LISSISRIIVEQQENWLEEQRRTWRRIMSVPRALEAARQTKVGATPHDVVFEKESLKVLRYRRQTPARYSEPVLLCYALINRPYILDLQPDKSVVRRYLERGFDVYMIDWGVPSDADHVLKIEDYVSRRLASVVDFVLREHGIERLHLLGYCMGGTLSAILTALRPELVRTLTLLAAPIEFGGKESLLNVWTNRKYFDVDAFIDAHGNCPATFLQSCFRYMKPVQNLLEKNIALFEQLDDPGFITNYFAMERWVNDNIPVAGETFREFVKNLYQNNELVRGEFRVDGQRVDLGRIECPLLLLTAKNDHLVAPPATNGIRARVGSRDVKAMTIDAGHVGLVVSSKAHRTFWPEATEWLSERCVSAAQAV